MDELWDIARVASYLGVTERTVYDRVRSGAIPAVKVGRLWRVRSADLERWLSGSVAGAGSARETGMHGRAELERSLAGVADTLERRLLFVAHLSAEVAALGGQPPVVVGGHAVEFYTAGGYTTVDIDLAGASEPVAAVLGSWGFSRSGRHWYDEALGIVVEVPGSPLSREALDHVVTLEIGDLAACVIGIEDLVVDRLAACVHWGHAESCDWARALLDAATDLDEPYLAGRASAERVAGRLAEMRAGGAAS